MDKKIVISSKSDNSNFSGDIDGIITNITSNPVHLGLPIIAKVKADFPHQNIRGIDSTLTIDHTTDKPVETIQGVVASFPVKSVILSESDDLNFSINSATGFSKFNGSFKDSTLRVKVDSKFGKVKYGIQAKNKDLKDILQNTVRRIPVITLTSSARGGWNDIAWGFDSNLGTELSKGIKQNIQAKIDAQINKIKNQVNEKIKSQKDKLLAQYNKIAGQASAQAQKIKSQTEAAKANALNDMNAKKRNAENSKKKELENAGKKLLKGFGF